MTDLGQQIRDLIDRSAPPITYDEVTGSVTHTQVRANWAPGLAAVILVLVAGAFSLVFGVWQPGDSAADPSPSATADESTSADASDEVATTLATLPSPVMPVRIDCTTELSGFPCTALFDGDSTTSWQASQGIVGAAITLFFEQPIAVDTIGFTNVADDTQFVRNHRIRGLEITTDDLSRVTLEELPDSNAVTHLIQVTSIRTTMIRILITSAYPSAQVGDLEPFDELALAEISVNGYPVSPLNPVTSDTRLIIKSITAFGAPDVVPCPSARPEIRFGEGQGMLYSEPRDALRDWISRFNNEFLGDGPPIAEHGYLELSFLDGRDGYIYAVPLALQELAVSEATFGMTDDGGVPRVGLDSRVVVELRVVPVGDAWEVDYWQVSGC